MTAVEIHPWEAGGHVREPGIYCVLAVAGLFKVWIYVGMSAQPIATRVSSHRQRGSRTGPIFNAMTSDGWDVLFYEVPVEREDDETMAAFRDRLRALERRGIAELRPLLNASCRAAEQYDFLHQLMGVRRSDLQRPPLLMRTVRIAGLLGVCESDLWDLVEAKILPPPREVHGVPWWGPDHMTAARELLPHARR